MAFHLQVGGNTSVVIGGAWNTDTGNAGASWTNPFAAITSFTIALTVKPDDPFSAPTSGAMSHLIHQWGGSASGATWQFGHQGGGSLLFVVYDGDDSTQTRFFATAAGALVPGVWNRIMARWSGALDQCQITVNGVDWPTTKTGHVVTVLQNSTGLTGPWEIGAISWRDEVNLAADYAEVAGWLGYKADADAVHYGQGWSPDLLPSTGRLDYVDLRAFSNRTFFGGSTSEWHANTVGRWTGINYGATTIDYGPFGFLPPQGFWSATTAAPVSHPEVFGTGPGETPLITTVPRDRDITPRRQVHPSVLVGRYGKRSGTVLGPFSTDAALRAGLNAATPGDTVLIDHTAQITLGSELTLPQATTWTIGPSTPRFCPDGVCNGVIEAAGARQATTTRVATATREVAGEPSYVEVTTDARASLPPITTTMITLVDGTKVRRLLPSGRINRTHYAAMPTIRAPVGGELVLNLGGNKVTSRWAFHGIRWQARENTDTSYLFWISDDQNIFTYGIDLATTKFPSHIAFNQIAIEADPLGLGYSCAAFGVWAVLFGAFVNSYMDKFWGVPGGDPKIFAVPGGGFGPTHWENNDIRSAAALYFAGGGGWLTVGQNPSDFHIRHNWLHAPLSERPSEVNPGGRNLGWTVNIATGATPQVTLVSGGTWVFRYNPVPGSIIYSRTTGRARRVASVNEFVLSNEGSAEPVFLSAAWPGAPITNMPIGMQLTTDDPQTTQTLYNSGLDEPMPTATWNTTTRHVVVSAALPQNVVDALTAGHRIYFYPNSSVWQGDFIRDDNPSFPPAWTQDVTSNGWGPPHRQNVPWAAQIRKRIVAIDGDRLGFTFDSAQNLYTSTQVAAIGSGPFPYSIVRGDGLCRSIYDKYKGSWENKCGVRWIHEGNLFVGTANRCYVNDQTNGGLTFSTLTVTIAGDIATVSGGVWPPLRLDRGFYGSPWAYSVISTNGSGPDSPSQSRAIKAQLSPTVVSLYPVDPRMAAASLTSFTGTLSLYHMTTPWVQIKDFLIRYNIWEGGNGAPIFQGEAPYGGHTQKGGNQVMHDNLELRPGDQSVGTPGLGTSQVGPICQERDSTAYLQPGNSFGPGGMPGYDEPLSQGANGAVGYYHNSVVRPKSWTLAKGGLFMGFGNTIDVKATHVELSSNLFAMDARGANFFVTNEAGAEAVTMDGSLDPATTRTTRNVVAGPQAASLARTTLAATNSGVADPTKLGLADLNNADGYRLANYVLQDLFTTGTVAIAADGLSVSLESGALPATVVPGLYFKTSTSDTLAKITGLGVLLSSAWATIPTVGRFAARGGVAVPLGSPNGATLQIHTQVLGNDQFAEVTVPSFVRTDTSVARFGLGIRMSGTSLATLNGYIFWIEPNGSSPSINFLAVYRWDNGVLSYAGLAADVSVAQGDLWHLEMVGTSLSIRRNGVAVLSGTPTGTPFTSGKAALHVIGTNLSVAFANFACGTSGGGALATDAFTGGANAFILDALYPEAGVTGKQFAVTLKNSGHDGRDPGVHIPTLALMTDGVYDPALVD